MSFRENETEQFPFWITDRVVWYGLLLNDAGFHRLSFTASKSGKKTLVEQIVICQNVGSPFLVIGVWQGQWKTDIFVLDPDITIAKMQEAIK
jgi:hypothetical protein